MDKLKYFKNKKTPRENWFLGDKLQYYLTRLRLYFTASQNYTSYNIFMFYLFIV